MLKLRFENPRYRPKALVVEPGGAPIHVTLEDAKQSDWLVASCEESGSHGGRVGFSVLFAVPANMETRPFNEGNDHSYFIHPRAGSPDAVDLVITTNSDRTEDSDSFIHSASFEHRWIKNKQGAVVGLDSRGKMIDGGSWRTASFLEHDSISYLFFRRKDTTPLDKIIDSACLAKK